MSWNSHYFCFYHIHFHAIILLHKRICPYFDILWPFWTQILNSEKYHQSVIKLQLIRLADVREAQNFPLLFETRLLNREFNETPPIAPIARAKCPVYILKNITSLQCVYFHPPINAYVYRVANLPPACFFFLLIVINTFMLSQFLPQIWPVLSDFTAITFGSHLKLRGTMLGIYRFISSSLFLFKNVFSDITKHPEVIFVFLIH